MGLSIYEKELLALVTAVTKWRHYLEGHHFIIHTDHQSLKYLLEQRITTPLQQKWLTKLLGLSYEIHYKKGKDNVAADALSRQGREEIGECSAVSCAVPSWIQEVLESYKEDEWIKETISQVLLTPTQVPDYSYHDGILRYKKRLVVGDQGDIREKIITALHDSQVGGHSGIQASYLRAKNLFYWPGMYKTIKEKVLECDTCRKCKDEHVAYPGLLQPLPIPQHSWSHVTMDFIEGLPQSEGKNTIMVVVDRFTKYAHFISLTHPFDAPKVARLFIDQVSKLHGMPQNMLSDRDRIVVSQFWWELFTKLGAKLDYSTVYHPQIDGQTERMNQVLEMYLRCVTHLEPKKWNSWLSLAEWWYNTTFHTAIQMSPFEALYGTKPPQLALGPYMQTKVATVED